MPEEPKKPEEEKKDEKKEPKPEPKDNLVTTQHAVTIGGKEIRYTATAGTMVMKEETADREKEQQTSQHRHTGEKQVRPRTEAPNGDEVPDAKGDETGRPGPFPAPAEN